MDMAKTELIGGIQRFSTEDGPGIRTTVFFKGCPLKCLWCHNPELLNSTADIIYSNQKCIKCGECVANCCTKALRFTGKNASDDDLLKILIHSNQKCTKCGRCVANCCTEALRFTGKNMSDDDLLKILMKDKGFYNETGGGVTFSGGEVTSQADYAYRLLRKCNEKKLSVAIDTCGYCDIENLMKLCKFAEVVLFDIKCVDEHKHKKLTNVSNQLILQNLNRLCEIPEIKEKIIIRLPLIHNINDTEKDLTEVCRLLIALGLTKVDGLPYHSLGISKSRNLNEEYHEFETPPDTHIDKIIELFNKFNIKINIMGREK